jgi:hypothetical protein
LAKIEVAFAEIKKNMMSLFTKRTFANQINNTELRLYRADKREAELSF